MRRVLLAVVLLAGCRDGDVKAVSEGPQPKVVQGTSCDMPGDSTHEDGCRACVCTEGGVWECFHGFCAHFVISEPRAALLVVIDDSSSMGVARQTRLAQGLSELVAAFDAHVDPVELRIGFTTTDFGNPLCDPATNDEGALLLRSCHEHLQDFEAGPDPSEAPIPDDAADQGCLSQCTLADLKTMPTAAADDPDPKPRPWLQSFDGETNLASGASMAEALACAVPQGVRGCDFESPMHAARAALTRTADPGDPAYGLLGADSDARAVLWVTDEADCSYQDEWVTVFDPAGKRRFWSDPTADAATSAVCWNAGVRCTGGPGTYDDCQDANINTADIAGSPSSDAVLDPAESLASDLWSLTASPGALQSPILAGLLGVPEGYDGATAPIVYTDGSDDPAFALQYGVGPGCGSGDDRAVPPARMLEVAFDHIDSVCADDYGPALRDLADAMLADIELRSGCYWMCAADTDPDTPALDPWCDVSERWVDDQGSRTRLVPPCDGEKVPPGEEICYLLRHDDTLPAWCQDQGTNLQIAIRRDRSVPPPATTTEILAACQPSDDAARDCPNMH